jgi:subtilisin family serine protease
VNVLRLVSIAAATMVALLVLAASASADADYVPGQVVVRYAPGTGPSDRDEALRAVDAQSSDRLPIPDAHVIDLAQGDSVPDAVAKLNARSDVRYAEPNYIYKPTRTPNDTLFGQQWGQLNTAQTFNPDSDGPPGTPITGIPGVDMGAAPAWDTVTGDPNILVGVADTGVIAGHPDLEPDVRRDLARDFRAESPSQINPGADANGHGTHVAGTIGAVGNNARGVAGVSWNPGIVPLRVLNSEGGPDTAIAAGFAYAGEAGLRIVNASLGGPGDAQITRDAILLSPNTLFVVAAGNDANDNDGPNPAFPCAIPADNLICVAATNPRDGLASFSNFGRTSVDLGAPGTNILSTFPIFDTIRTAGFAPADWTLSGPVWTLNGGVSLDAAWMANEDETAELSGSLDLTNRRGCSATLEGEADITEDEAALTLERSTDNGLTWTTIDTIDTPRTNANDNPINDRVDLRADTLTNVQLRLHWVTGNVTGAHNGATITRLEMQCTRGGDAYQIQQGTSMASPEVAGAAALVLARNPSLTVAQLRDALLSTVTPVPALNGRTVTGGRINVAAAVAKAAPPVPNPPASGGSGTGTTTTTTTTTPPTAPPLLPVTTTTGNATVRVTGARTQNFLRTGAVTIKVTTDRDAALSATGSIALSKAGAAAGLRLRAAKGRAVAGRATTLKLKLTPGDLRKLRAAVRAKRRATAKIAVRVTPATGSATTTKTSVRQKGR